LHEFGCLLFLFGRSGGVPGIHLVYCPKRGQFDWMLAETWWAALHARKFNSLGVLARERRLLANSMRVRLVLRTRGNNWSLPKRFPGVWFPECGHQIYEVFELKLASACYRSRLPAQSRSSRSSDRVQVVKEENDSKEPFCTTRTP